MTKEIIEALQAKYVASKLEAVANLKNYVENPAGIGEHGDITDTIAEQISKVAEADDALLVLEENFTVDPKSGKYS